MKNQGGFATFEVILAVIIISVLAFVAVPKIDRVIDKIALDYEMKRLCSEIEFASSLNRSAGFDPEIFDRTFSSSTLSKGDEIVLDIDEENNSWQLRRDTKFLRDRHYLFAGIKIRCSTENVKHIAFSPNGVYKPKSVLNSPSAGTITLTSRHGETAEIVFDTVGRWRGNRKT